MKANYTPAHYEASAAYMKQRMGGFVPDALLILGSGLGFLGDELQQAMYIPYADIPHMRASTAPGHAGRFVAGELAGRKVLVMQGRLHVYEGYTPEEAAYPVRAAHLLGATRLLVTCACGGVNTDYHVGDIAVLTDYINFTHPGPLTDGFDLTGFDTRFFDMSCAFDSDYRAAAHQIAAEQGLTLRDGVYYYMPGPQFETPAEIRAIRTLGGDLVGMSTVHETIMARRHNMRVLGLGLVTNMAAGVLPQALSEEEVLVEGRKAAGRFSALVRAVVEGM